MPEIRQNPATKEWVIIATERAKRPEDFVAEEEEYTIPDYLEDCPFCPGNEDKTPPEIMSYGDGNGNWTLRVVPNKFPALVPHVLGEREEDFDFFRRMDGLGQHEVIIETPKHNESFGTIDDAKALEIVTAYRERYLALSEDKRFKLVKIFRNQGKAAGTSLEHPHSQIVATPVVPLHIRHRLEEATRYYDNHGKCVFCRMIEMERKEGERIVMEEDGFVVIQPFAARVPFETWILPLDHHATFGEIPEQELKGFARALNRILGRLMSILHQPAYNLVVRTAPSGEEGEEYYHWHVQIIPRLTTPAGFELGTGVYINTALPEITAAFTRES
ncbi:MAG: galactose-1-phosphate uridylyltransferase [bacterium]|nr:MAG: galactose-1-phosphate uridylyltransferase [bacterium]